MNISPVFLCFFMYSYFRNLKISVRVFVNIQVILHLGLRLKIYMITDSRTKEQGASEEGIRSHVNDPEMNKKKKHLVRESDRAKSTDVPNVILL